MAGIAIWALTGENGLFARAKEARQKTQKEAATEKINLVIADVYTKSYAEKQENPTLQDLADGLCEGWRDGICRYSNKKNKFIR